MCRTHIILTLIFIGGIQSSGICQQPHAKNSFYLRPCFAGIQKGFLPKYDHMEDSLAFTDSLANDMFHVSSFKIALACNGNVVKYLENKSGNKFTPEMKDAIREMHPGCTISFQGIKAISVKKGFEGQHLEFPGILKLTLKD